MTGGWGRQGRSTTTHRPSLLFLWSHVPPVSSSICPSPCHSTLWCHLPGTGKQGKLACSGHSCHPAPCSAASTCPAACNPLPPLLPFLPPGCAQSAATMPTSLPPCLSLLLRPGGGEASAAPPAPHAAASKEQGQDGG